MLDDETLERFLAYEAEVRQYGLTWWLSDASAQARTGAHPDVRTRAQREALRGDSVQTATIYCDATGVWDPDRELVHTAACTEAFELVGAEPEDPAVVFLLGIPGSGKSTTLLPLAQTHLAAGSTLVRDVDRVRALLPEFEHGLGSLAVQEEASWLAYKDRFEDLLSKPCHLVCDTVGDVDWTPREVRAALDRGRRVYVLCATVSVEVAVDRAVRRALDGGRYVGTGYIEGRADSPEMTLRASVALGLTGWALLDTTGDVPTLVDGDGTFDAHVASFEAVTDE